MPSKFSLRREDRMFVVKNERRKRDGQGPRLVQRRHARVVLDIKINFAIQQNRNTINVTIHSRLFKDKINTCVKGQHSWKWCHLVQRCDAFLIGIRQMSS